jgi:hypothetical protein
MNHDEIVEDANHLPGWQKHRFMLMVGCSIVISLLMVGVSLKLYASSGAAQLDLSRPGYEHVSETVSQAEVFKGFSSTGSIDKQTFEEFRAMYAKRAAQATDITSFGGDVMNDAALSIDAPVPPAEQQ